MNDVPKTECPPLPADRLERVDSWGMASSALSYVHRPSTAEGVQKAFDEARRAGRPIGFRGAGRSYGDASLNGEGLLLDLTRMNRILEWNPETGVISVEPGVTIQQLWQFALGDGWWPPVVPGTMYPTLGGCLSMNIHGKNNWKMGPIGDHILEFEIMLPSGEIKRCAPDTNQDLFRAVIGGFGMFGAVTRLTIQLKRVYSGQLAVTPVSVQSFDEMFAEFAQRTAQADYLVGWIDCFATGTGLGRGLIHQANYLAAGEDPHPTQTLRVENQELPDTILGVFPKSLMWRFMRPLVNNSAMATINFAKYLSGTKLGDGKVHHQSHAGFAFLLDYVPNWKMAYSPHGLIQYQSFVPAESAQVVFSEQLKMAQRYGIVPYLGVFKQHRSDQFLMTHAVDGFSMALDFPMVPESRGRLLSLTAEMDQLVLNAGGRFYFAKDSTLHRSSIKRAFAPERLQEFTRLKTACDPDGLIQTNLYRRLFAG